MAGRKPKVNWTPFYNQFTCTIDGKFHRLGKDLHFAQLPVFDRLRSSR